jgi:hypothetical protein
MSTSNVGSVATLGHLRRCAQAFATRATEVHGRSDAVATRSPCPHGFMLEQGWRSPQGLRHFPWLIRRSQTLSLGIASLDRLHNPTETGRKLRPVVQNRGVME